MTSLKPVTLTTLREMKRTGEKIACLTAYDASFARLLDEAGMDLLMVGDSLGMVIQGHDSTLPVTVADMIYHTRNVRRGARRAFVVTDMPFMSYASPAQAVGNAARILQEGGAQMVKLEGGAWLAETVRELSVRGIPVCAHLGLLPQSVHQLGGYRVQGRDPLSAQTLLDDAKSLEEAGASLLLLESVPAALAADITRHATAPVIGIGAGPQTDGQILVLYDLLGITEKRPKFSKDFLAGEAGIQEAVQAYIKAVKLGAFPAAEHTFS
ncbi:MAG: 3-methyl-2-oxobutanoate hydroxymethyltransferase [Gammaproteobacteria bacterium]|nr:3-methyl-2-oxobutanoate hydroxymethyltransferase [Gammaproteobacteria bacterium]